MKAGDLCLEGRPVSRPAWWAGQTPAKGAPAELVCVQLHGHAGNHRAGYGVWWTA